MQDHVYKIDYKDKEILLIATAHVSKQSADLVKRVIEEEKPDSVCIELDAGRFETLKNPKAWENTDIVKVIKSKQVVFLLANLILSSYQKRIADKLKISVGQEMLQGIESAKECGAELILADRSIQTTFMRIWRKMSFWEKIKLFWAFFMSVDDDQDISEEDLSELLQTDVLDTVMKDMRTQFPKIGEILISERDQYLASKIKNAPGKKIVAILGGAHVPGVKEELFKEQDLDKIMYIPPPSKVAKLIGWLIPLVIIGLIINGFMMSLQTGMAQLSAWVLWNGALAALFTAVALRHPISIVTAFVVAPISSLNPLLACGWFTGLMEASLRKPTVSDVNSVPKDMLTIKGFFKNRFLRILLVVIMANLGSTVGTFVAGLDLIRNLF
jgi:pheromone shutdown-related protein TraB